MANVAVNDIFSVIQVGNMFDQRILSTYAYQVFNIAAGPVDTATLAAALDAQLSAPGELLQLVRNAAPTDYNHVETWYQRIAPTRVVRDVFAGTGVGTNGAANVSNVAAVVERRGDIANRKNISCLHVPMADVAANVVAGYVTAAMTSKLVAIGAKLITSYSLTAGGATVVMVPCIYNKGSVPNCSIITRYYAQATSRVMRRRTVGVGE